ncbi:MAG TPA: GlsB/YeaQ/YmgE family stress response membrane protein [Gemmatimonadales bacterium]|nr:GlsB/YeaQ/YmgE family stress response membrane protein [Gemmatimonadales bacterium]
MGLMHIVWSIIVGFIVGLLARALLPGADHMGVLATIVVGIVGSLIGGFIGRLMSKPAPGARFHPAGFFMSIVGAVVLLIILRFAR